MALSKQTININFAKGIETKTDPNQLPIDSFLALHNSVFTETGRLTKRNGFANITTLPVTTNTTLTTLSDNLIATGSNLYSFSSETNQWFNKGITQPVQLNTQSLVRVSTSQLSIDAAVSSTNLVCTVYIDNAVSYYQVSDARTGTQIVARTALESTATNPRVFSLGRYFIITYMATITGTATFRYIAISMADVTNIRTPKTISTSVSAITDGHDGIVTNNSLYLAWSGTGTTVKLAFLSASLIISSTVSVASATSTLMSITADTVNSLVYLTYWTANDAFTVSFNYSLVPIMASTQVINSLVVTHISSIILDSILHIYYEVNNSYSYSGGLRTDYIETVTVTPTTISNPGTVSSPVVMIRSVGLASKPFIQNSIIYMLVIYGNATDNQPTYFLSDFTGNITMRLAYSNGGGYISNQVLPTVSANTGVYSIPYLIKDFLATVNKTTNPALPVNAIYTQTGINLATFTINDDQQYSNEIANALHLTGGQLWEYDGVKPVEHGFHLWPEDISGSTSTTGGSLVAQKYNYVFTYEWTDNAGNLHRSAPSIPYSITTTGSTSTNTLYVPTLRLTAKVSPNPIRIVGYRWSVAQQVYYQFTSLTSPTTNNTSVDYVTLTDTQADSSILGNVILYTTGGVIENIAAPASVASALFDNRLWLVDAEDRNLLWYSKQVIENTPVEMSDLLTIYVAPTSGAQGSTGPVAALSAMDDKLIIFKKDAIYYVNGIGPDNTGANSSYSDAIFITSTVGTILPNSIVLMPNGIMFQSDKGIWLLGRDLSSSYIGSPVESYTNSAAVVSAKAIPATNQVRFILDNNITLMYDYFQNQWGTHSNVAAISSTLYQSSHTYLNSNGQVYQETPGLFVDGSSPVLLSLTSAWINVAGLQGFERFYFGYLLGSYYTPFKLDINIAYNYQTGSQQNIKISPDNYAPAWGGEALWGSGGPWGGSSSGNVFEARFFPQIQKCQSFQITINEVYDSSLGVAPGQGLSLSGLALVIGTKRGFRTQSSGRSFGSN